MPGQCWTPRAAPVGTGQASPQAALARARPCVPPAVPLPFTCPSAASSRLSWQGCFPPGEPLSPPGRELVGGCPGQADCGSEDPRQDLLLESRAWWCPLTHAGGRQLPAVQWRRGDLGSSGQRLNSRGQACSQARQGSRREGLPDSGAFQGGKLRHEVNVAKPV